MRANWKRAALAAPALLYVALTLMLGWSSVGLQYDEALFHEGGVYLQRGGDLPLDAAKYWHTGGKAWPLMTMPYAGAIKDYASWPVFAAMGASVSSVRLVSVLLTAMGLLGLTLLATEVMGFATGLTAAMLTAMHPSVVDLTLYDSSVAPWMCGAGLVAVTVRAWGHAQRAASNVAIGIAVGLLVWTRLNTVWMIGAAIVAAAIVYRRWPTLKSAALVSVGALLGFSPFLLYFSQASTQFFETARSNQLHATLWQLLSYRTKLWTDVMVADGQHRAIWGADLVPFPLRIAFGVAWIGVLVWALRTSQPRHVRWMSITALLTAAAMVVSSFAVAEHHLVTLLPLMIAVLVSVSMPLRWGKAGIATLAVFWLGCDVQNAMGVRSTGGVKSWSDASTRVAEVAMQAGPKARVACLDWGIATQLYVLTNGSLRCTELFWSAEGGRQRPWAEVARDFDVLIASAPQVGYFPLASQEFRANVDRSTFHVAEVSQRDGQAAWEVWARR